MMFDLQGSYAMGIAGGEVCLVRGEGHSWPAGVFQEAELLLEQRGLRHDTGGTVRALAAVEEAWAGSLHAPGPLTVDRAIAALFRARDKVGGDAPLLMMDSLPVTRFPVAEGVVFVSDAPEGD
jgi:hypothetical protein